MFSVFRRYGVIPFVKVETEEDAVSAAKALSDAGMPIMELVFRSFAHSKAIRRIRKEMPDFVIGVGNILNKDQLIRSADCGARFAFSPGADPETTQTAMKCKIIYSPGICTPSELQRALLNGAGDVQFFPAEASGGVPMLQSIIDPFLHLGVQVYAKGGITPDSMKDYLAFAPVAAVSAPWIVTPERVGNKDWRAITNSAMETMELVKQIRS